MSVRSISRAPGRSRLSVAAPRLLLVLAALVVLLAVWRSGGDLSYGDEREYAELTRAVASGQGYTAAGQATAFRPPSWVVVLVPWAALGGGHDAALGFVPGLLLIASGLVAASLASRITGSPWGALAGVAVMLYPLDLYSATTLYPQVFATFLLLALWAQMDHLSTQGQLGAGRSLLVGILCSALALGVPTLILTAGLVLAWVLWRHRRQRLLYLLLGGAGFAIPILAWGLRNLLVLGSPVLFSTSGGLNLLLGNGPNTTPSSGVAADITAYVDQADALALSEIERNAYYGAAAQQWVAAHPGDAALLYLGKLGNYFVAYNAPVTGGQGSAAQAALAWVGLLTLVALVAVRLWLARSERLPFRRPEAFILVLWFVNAPFMAIFFTRTRFRQPLDSLLAVEAAIALVTVVGLWQGRRRSARATPQP